MEVFYVGGFVRDIIFILLGIGMISLGYFLAMICDFDLCGSISSTIGTILVIIAGISLLVGNVLMIEQKTTEQVIYQEMIAEKRSLEQVLSCSDDIINTELYSKAIDWNSNLAKIQAAQKDPKYAISFSGEVDWSTLDPINIK